MTITNVLFGLFHVPWYVGNWLAGDYSFDTIGCIQRVIVTGAMGVYFSYLYEKTGSLTAPMLVHGFSNSIEPFVAFLGPLIFPSELSVTFFEWRYVIAGLVAFPVYIAITRWLVRLTFKTGVSKPWS